MKREIRFKAWNLATKEMNNYVEIYNYNDGSVGCSAGKYNNLAIGNTENFILLQYTGLKDKLGKEIYEGDILWYSQRNHWFKVFSVPGGFAVNIHQDDFKKENVFWYSELSNMQNSSWVTQLEIKGNIYEHPHLLKNSADETN